MNDQHDESRQEQISIYLAAVEYACELIGFEKASRYFESLHQLSQYKSLRELKSALRGWCAADAPPLPPSADDGPWAVGAQWGNAVRVKHDSGIFWKLRCACGKYFSRSTNDTVPDQQRQCSACCLAAEMAAATAEVITKLTETSNQIIGWYRDYDKVVWKRVRMALSERGLTGDEAFAHDLHGLCWVHISEKASQYRDIGHKPSAWLGTVASHCIADYFRVNDNRQKIVPTTNALSTVEGWDDTRQAAAPPTCAEEVLPAKATAVPINDVVDGRKELYDKKLGKDWAA